MTSGEARLSCVASTTRFFLQMPAASEPHRVQLKRAKGWKMPENTVKVKVNVSEAGTLTLRLKLGKKVVATETVDANAGPVSAQNQ